MWRRNAAANGGRCVRNGFDDARTLVGRQTECAARLSAETSAMEAKGARRRRRIDAQHDSATGIAGDARGLQYRNTGMRRT